MERCTGAAGDGFHHFSVFNRVETPDRGFAAPVAHIFAVEGHAVLEIHPVADHGVGHPGHIRLGHTGEAVFGRGIQRFFQQLRLGPVKALLRNQKITDGIIQSQGAMGQTLPVPRSQIGHKQAVLIQLHPVSIGENTNLADVSGGIVTDVHGRTHRQNRNFLLLAGIHGRCQLGIPEGVHHTVVADPVAGTEILVGGIVKHAPADAADVASVCRRIVLDPGMAQGMLLPLLPRVKGFGREHMAVVLRDQQALLLIRSNGLFRLDTGIIAGVGEIVVGIHIIDQMALLDKPDTGGGPAGVQGMGHLVGAKIECIIILALVDPDTPEHDAGMAAVLQDHFPGVLHCLVLPSLITNVLPAGNLCEYQQAQLITLVDEMMALGIVGGPDDHTAQLLFQNSGVLPLQAFRNRVTHIGVALMAV